MTGEGNAKAFLKLAKPGTDPLSGLWLRALAFVGIDLVMNLSGKHPRSRLLAIAPVDNPGSSTQTPMKLPGGRVFGFAGFTSKVNRVFEVALAKYCTRQFLEMKGGHELQTDVRPLINVPNDVANLKPVFSQEEQATFQADVDKGMRQLASRVGAMVQQSHFVNMVPGLNQLLMGIIAGFVEKSVQQLGTPGRKLVSYEFRVTVPGKGYEWDGKGFGDQDIGPVRVKEGGPWVLVTFADYDVERKAWEGPHVDSTEKVLRVDSDGMFADSNFCKIAMPTNQQVRAARWKPHPIFSTTVEERDEDLTIPSNRWVVSDEGVTPLEQIIFED